MLQYSSIPPRHLDSSDSTYTTQHMCVSLSVCVCTPTTTIVYCEIAWEHSWHIRLCLLSYILFTQSLCHITYILTFLCMCYIHVHVLAYTDYYFPIQSSTPPPENYHMLLHTTLNMAPTQPIHTCTTLYPVCLCML